MLARMWSKGNTPPLLVEVQTCTCIMWWFLRKVGIVLPQNPAIPLLGTYSKDPPLSLKDTYTTMYISTLFVIANVAVVD